jgi:hypothetical protein
VQKLKHRKEKSTEVLSDAGKEIGPEVNVEKTKFSAFTDKVERNCYFPAGTA